MHVCFIYPWIPSKIVSHSVDSPLEILLATPMCPLPEGNKLPFINYIILALVETVIFILTMVAGFVHCMLLSAGTPDDHSM